MRLSNELLAGLANLVLFEDPQTRNVVMVHSALPADDRLVVRVEEGAATRILSTWTLPRDAVEERLPQSHGQPTVAQVGEVLAALYRERAGDWRPGHGQVPRSAGDPLGTRPTDEPSEEEQALHPRPIDVGWEPQGGHGRPYGGEQRIDSSGGPGDPDLDF